MTRPLKENHIAKPHLRMRSTGKTRFHDAIGEAWSRDRVAWLDVPNCPYNRRDREGLHPLVSAVKRLASDMKKPVSEVGEMPSWWKDVYKEDTTEDWIRKQTQRDEKTLHDSWLVFEKCLEHVNWKDWKHADVAAVLKATPIPSFKEDDRNAILDRLVASGLPIDRLRHCGNPVTPAMWSLLSSPYSYSIEGWLLRDLPLDPPGNKHPGFVSTLVFNWKRIPESVKISIDRHLEVAFSKGARVDLPPAPREWVEHEKSNRDSHLPASLYSSYDHCNRPTVLGQAQELDDPKLLAAIGGHVDVSDEDRIDSLLALMKLTADGWKAGRAAKSIYTNEQHVDQLLVLLEDPARDRSKWKNSSALLLSQYFETIWPRVSARDDERILDVLARMGNVGVDLGIDLPDIKWESIASIMAWAMTLPEAIEAMDTHKGALSKCKGLDRNRIGNKMSQGFLDRCLNERYDRPDKALGMLRRSLSIAPLDPAHCERMQATLFGHSQSAIGIAHLKTIVSMLRSRGWRSTSNAWNTLHARLSEPETHDSLEIISYLAKLAAQGEAPTCVGIFRAPVHNLPANNNNSSGTSRDGYRDLCDWGYADALKAHVHMVQCCLPLVDINATQWQDINKSPLQTVAECMDKTTRSDTLVHLDELAELLLCSGADPSKERNHETGRHGAEWVEDIDKKHAFYGSLSRWSKTALENHTPPPSAGPRPRRI